MSPFGSLPDSELLDFIRYHHILDANPDNVRPSSLDLTLSPEIYRVRGVFLPQPKEYIRDLLPLIDAREHDFRYPLEKHVTYLVKLDESLDLPPEIYGFCNPRSSTGRNDLLVRILADGVNRYDTIPAGYQGQLWAVISPQSYPVLLDAGYTLSQLRLFENQSRVPEEDLASLTDDHKLLWKKRCPLRFDQMSLRDHDGSHLLSVNLTGDIVGWECLGTDRVLDFGQNGAHEAEEFFTPLTQHSHGLTLRKGGFYILKTKENVRIPPHIACEMRPMDERSGEFRAHYAGFIDPGWGYGHDGEGKGRSLVLEIRPFEDLIIRDNQPVAKIYFDYMTRSPEYGYDQLSASHYTNDFSAPKLSRHFK